MLDNIRILIGYHAQAQNWGMLGLFQLLKSAYISKCGVASEANL